MGSVKFEFCAKFCVLGFLALIFCYLIVLLGVFSDEIQMFRDFKASKSEISLDQLNAYSSSIFDSYQKATMKPIHFLYTIPDNSSSCNDDDELLSLYLRNTQTICTCPYSSNFSAGQCPSSNLKNCYTSSEGQLDFSNWKGVKFCVSRITDWYKKTTDSQCQSNYMDCLNNMCVNTNNSSNSSNCPITGIQISGNSSTNNLSNYSFISNFSDGSSLYITRTIGQNFVIDLEVEINGVPCIYNYETPIRNESFLLESIPDGCHLYGDDQSIYTEIDSQNESDMYDQNNDIEIGEYLKNDQKLQNDSAMLFSVITPITKCIFQYKLTLDDPIFNTLSELRNGGNVIGVVLIVIYLILFFIHIWGLYTKRILTDSITLAFLMILLVFIQAIVCPISLAYVSQLITNNEYLYDMNLNQCFANDGYNRMVSDLLNFLLINTSKVFNIIYTILYFSLIIFLCTMLYLMDKINYNYFFDEEGKGALEDTDILENCKINSDDLECDCIL